MDEKPRVAIVGAGQLGKAIAFLLKEKDVDVALWDANPAAMPVAQTLENAVFGARFVFFCIPSGAMKSAVGGVLGFMAPGVTVVSFSKGMEQEWAQTMAEMLPSLIPLGHPLVVVGGPMLADEILAGGKAVGVFASADADALAEMKALFSGKDFTVETSKDTVSVALAGVLKNVYAVALGIADGLGLSGSEKGWITARAAEEMQAIAIQLKADPAVMRGPAGLGDLIATGYSAYSRNRGVGEKIAKTEPLDLRGEGLTALPCIVKRLGEKEAATFPLLMAIQAVATGAPAATAFDAFFRS